MENPSTDGPRRPPVRRFTWLLLLLLASLALLVENVPGRVEIAPAPDPSVPAGFGMPEPPPVVRASGEMAEVYRSALPAALRIESRCGRALFGGMPVDVGSGLFVSPEGLVLTAYHVVQKQRLAGPTRCPLDYVAIDAEGREHPLELYAFDAFRDIALLRTHVDAPVSWLPLADAVPEIGSEVVAIGNSRGEVLADRAGEVSRLGVSTGRADFASGTIELTAALAPGDSGGPVLDARGRVIGVVSYISFAPAVLGSENETPLAGLLGRDDLPAYAAYAVPVIHGSEPVKALFAGARRDVPVVGFEAAFDYDPRSPRAPPGLGRRPGVVVGRVQPGGPGEEAGLRALREIGPGDGAPFAEGTFLADVIVAVDGTPTPGFDELLEVVRGREVGETVALTVQRGNELVRLELELAAYRDIFP